MLLATVILLASSVANAGTTFEMGVGYARAEAKSDGIWYQKRFPYTLDLESDYIKAGFRTDLSEHIAIHNDVYRIGQNSSDALAVTHDDLYDKNSPTGCPHTCPRLANFVGRGHSWGIQSLVEFHTVGEWETGFLIGPIIYRSSWTMNIPDWFPIEPTEEGHWEGPVHPLHLKSHSWNLSGAVGVRVSDGDMFVELLWYRDGSSANRNSYYPPIWQSHFTLTYGREF